MANAKSREIIKVMNPALDSYYQFAKQPGYKIRCNGGDFPHPYTFKTII
jgi:hypothetical protein